MRNLYAFVIRMERRTQVVIKIIILAAIFKFFISTFSQITNVLHQILYIIYLYILMHSRHRLMSLQIFNQMKELSRNKKWIQVQVEQPSCVKDSACRLKKWKNRKTLLTFKLSNEFFLHFFQMTNVNRISWKVLKIKRILNCD